MEKQLNQLLNGIFEYEQEKPSFEPEALKLEAAGGEVLSGSFMIEGPGGKKINGYLYPSDARMICEPTEFHANSTLIRYQVDCSGLGRDGSSSGNGADKDEYPDICIIGRIAVCSDCGEYEIPYTVSLKRGEKEDELPFSDLAGFAALAEKDCRKAYRYFMMPGFRALMDGQPELTALYDALTAENAGYASMEEFLTGAGQKAPLRFTAELNGNWNAAADSDSGDGAGQKDQLILDLGELTEPVQEVLRVHRNTWGIRNISAESDSLFVRPERMFFSTDEFAGSSFDLNTIIDTNMMHGGSNYAVLTLKAGLQTIRVRISARKKAGWTKDHQGHVRKIMTKKMENIYVDFRLQKIELPDWIERSVSVINSYKRAGGESPFANLFLVQMYVADGKKHKAMSLFEQVEAQKEKLNTTESYAFYLYISTFIYREKSYVDQVEDEISRQYHRNPSSWILMWILMYLDEKYLDNPAARYEAVEEQFTRGCRSRIMYVEAWQALKENPILLRRLGEYELHLLRFADQAKALTAEILRQVSSLAMHDTVFDDRLYNVLGDGYRLYPSDDLARSVCQYLINCGRCENEYFKWYEIGVDAGFRINGLYENYLHSMDCTQFIELPQIIRMYFTYDTTLDYRKRAAIYRSISDNRQSDPQAWHNNRPAIERFVTDQLEAGHICDDLAELYSEFLREKMLTAQMSEKLLKLLFTYEITCDCEGPVKIAVHSCRLTKEYTADLTDGLARIQIYDPDSVILALDSKGQRFIADENIRARRVFESDKFLAICARIIPYDPDLDLFICSQSLNQGLMNEKLLPYFRTVAQMDTISDDFREKVKETILCYYTEHTRDETLPDFLEEISYDEYARTDKTALITLLAEEGKCGEAFSLLDKYGAEGIPVINLVKICSRMVLDLEFEENAMLLNLCHYCFVQGKYDDKLLRYLLLYYEGTVEEMKEVWRAAARFGLDTMLLEEKIMMMMIFTRSGTQDSEVIFESYRKKMGKKTVCKAYVNLKAYEYFVKGVPVADPVFNYIEKEYGILNAKGEYEDQEEVCRLALLQHYSQAASLDKMQRLYASEMLDEFNMKGMRFSFFKKFDEELIKPYQLEGHVFAEYVCNPKNTVYVLYRYRDETIQPVTSYPAVSEDGWIKEPAENRFEGIFVREFILFDQEELECCFEQTDPDTNETIRSDAWVLTADTSNAADGMYGLLNRLYAARRRDDEKEAQEAVESWYTMEYLAREAFTLM